MAHFRGLVQGARRPVTRLGNKNSGIHVEAQSWQGKICVNMWYNDDLDKDVVTVSLECHQGAGTSKLLYEGPVNGTL